MLRVLQPVTPPSPNSSSNHGCNCLVYAFFPHNKLHKARASLSSSAHRPSIVLNRAGVGTTSCCHLHGLGPRILTRGDKGVKRTITDTQTRSGQVDWALCCRSHSALEAQHVYYLQGGGVITKIGAGRGYSRQLSPGGCSS